MKPESDREIAEAARVLRAGGVVVLPTETVYGLGADATNPDAIARIFAVKGRPSDNPLIVHVHSTGQLEGVVRNPPRLSIELLERFAPGPLTVVFPVGTRVAAAVTAGLDTVAIRIPRHPVARRLLLEAGVPVAAPSANRSGEPSPTTLAMARASLKAGPDFYLDGGPCEVGIESTVVAVDGDRIRILRPGVIGAEEFRTAFPHALVEEPQAGGEGVPDPMSDLVRSPGTRHAHYQPRAKVLLLPESDVIGADTARALVTGVGRSPAIALIDSAAHANEHATGFATEVREYRDLQEYARNLYRWFSEFDEQRVDIIVARLPEPRGVGVALRDRLERASGREMVRAVYAK